MTIDCLQIQSLVLTNLDGNDVSRKMEAINHRVLEFVMQCVFCFVFLL